jgi:hypothetical protein
VERFEHADSGDSGPAADFLFPVQSVMQEHLDIGLVAACLARLSRITVQFNGSAKSIFSGAS